MSSFNKVILLGNVTRDVELKYTPKGTAVAQVGMAVNRVYKNDRDEKVEEVTFVDVDLFGRTAEIAGEYLNKGKQVLFEGRLKLDTWDDKESGKKRSKLRVIGETMQLLGGKKQDDSSHESPKSAPPRGRPAPPQDPDLDPASEDDIPF